MIPLLNFVKGTRTGKCVLIFKKSLLMLSQIARPPPISSIYLTDSPCKKTTNINTSVLSFPAIYLGASTLPLSAKNLKKISYLRRTLSLSPKSTKLLVYKTLIRPVSDYACPVWNPHKQGEIDKIEANLKKKAMRFICNRYDPYFSHSIPSWN